MINLSKNIQYFLFIFINLDSIDLPKFIKIINNLIISNIYTLNLNKY